MNQKNAEILLGAIIIARSTALLFSKILMRSMEPFNLMAIRFLLAFVLLAILFHKKLFPIKPALLLRGLLLGTAFFAVMSAELYGLSMTDSSTTAFLENTAIVLVPVFEAILIKRFPSKKVIGSASLTLMGVFLLTMKGGFLSFHAGEALCLLAALFYAGAIILTDRVSKQGDPLVLGIFQVGFIGLFAMVASFLTESPHLPSGGSSLAMIFYLAIVCTGFGFTLQPVAQRYTTAGKAGMYCALNPVTAAILGSLFLGESLGISGVLGALLVLSGILISRSEKSQVPKLAS